MNWLEVVGGTPNALRAVIWAATKARLRRLPLRIVHAMAFATPTDPVGQHRVAAILARAYTVARQHEPDVRTHTVRLDDRPGPALVQVSGGAGLLVLGMLSRHIEDVLVGSIAL